MLVLVLAERNPELSKNLGRPRRTSSSTLETQQASLWVVEEGQGKRLARAGVVRITGPGEMSRTIAGEAHDGDYPLQLYSRVVELG